MSLSITGTLWILVLSSAPVPPTDDPHTVRPWEEGESGGGVGGLNNQRADLKCGSLKHNLRAWATAVHQPHFLLCCFTNGSWKLNQNQGWRCTDGNNSLVIRAGKGPVQCADSPCAPVLPLFHQFSTRTIQRKTTHGWFLFTALYEIFHDEKSPCDFYTTW